MVSKIYCNAETKFILEGFDTGNMGNIQIDVSELDSRFTGHITANLIFGNRPPNVDRDGNYTLSIQIPEQEFEKIKRVK